jgi:hypothetical protein
MPHKDPLNLDLQNGCFIVHEQLGWIFAIREPRKLGLPPTVVSIFDLQDCAELKAEYPARSFKYHSKGHTWSKAIKKVIDDCMADISTFGGYSGPCG